MENTFGGGFTFGTPNFDPMGVGSDSVYLMSFVVDISGSIRPYEQYMTEMLQGIFEEYAKSSHADEMFAQKIDFSTDVNVKNGFQPLSALTTNDFVIQSDGGYTALYAASLKGFENILDYRTQLINSGIGRVKMMVIIITDGDDNVSQQDANKVKQLLENLRVDESVNNCMDIVMIGLGSSGDFEAARQKMGLNPSSLKTFGVTAKEIKVDSKNFISQSISKSKSKGNAVTF